MSLVIKKFNQKCCLKRLLSIYVNKHIFKIKGSQLQACHRTKSSENLYAVRVCHELVTGDEEGSEISR